LITFHESNLKRAVKNLFLQPNPSKVVLEFHLGLGDNLVCIALVRELVAREPSTTFYYPCPQSSFHTIVWIYRDLRNLFPIPIQNGREIRQLVGFLNARHVLVGVRDVDIKRFDAFFYEQHGVPFDSRWRNSYVDPGSAAEDLFQKLNPSSEPYLLICSRQSGNIDHQLKINNPTQKKYIYVEPLTTNLYDWMKLTLHADEIHTIDTSFVHFVENVLSHCTSKPSLFYHLIRHSQTEFTRRLPWNVVPYVWE